MSIAASRAGQVATTLVAAGLLLAGALLAASWAQASELAYRGCTTNDRELGPSGSGACTKIPRSAGSVKAVALSPNGRSLYSAGYVDGSTYAIAEFDRDPNTGALKYRRCITDHSGSGGCDVIPGARRADPLAPFYGLRAITVSPDGDSVYAVGYYSIARFERNPATGALAYRGCITGYATRGGLHSCAKIPTATDGGTGSGLAFLSDIAVSPEGNSVYVTAPMIYEGDGDATVAQFDRDPGSGALTWQGCVSGNVDLGPSGRGACTMVPKASPYALDSGLSPESLTLSPDGESLYTGSSRDCDDYGCWGSWGLGRFDRDPATGTLTFRGCITGNEYSGPSGSGACAAIPDTRLDMEGPGLIGNALATSSDGKSLYAGHGAVVARLHRNLITGAIRYRGCITGSRLLGPSGSGDCRVTPGATKRGRYSDLSGVQALVPNPNGKWLYAGGASKAIRLGRDPDTGALSLRECLTGDKRSGPSGSGACRLIRGATENGHGSSLGNQDIALALSEDRKSLYMASGQPYRIARFGFVTAHRR